jgi:hypothetical protein
MDLPEAAPIQRRMSQSDDLATLWSFVGGLRCLLKPVDGRWQIRIENGRETVRSHVARTSDEAVAIADQWLKECDGGTLPPEQILARHDEGVSNLTERGKTIIVGRLAQQLFHLTMQAGPAARLAILNVFLAGTLQALNDDPRLRALASDALADIAEASALLDHANATIAALL